MTKFDLLFAPVFADGRHRKLHPSPCESWGAQARYGDETWEEPILAQMAGIELDDATVAAVVGALGSAPRPITIDRARIDRQMRDLALEHAAGRLEDAAYLERLQAQREMKESLERTTSTGITAERAVAWLRTPYESWTRADVPEAKADLLHAIYEEIVVTGRRIMSIRLTPSAYAHGLALALPEAVWRARQVLDAQFQPTPARSRSRAATSGWLRPGCGHEGRASRGAADDADGPTGRRARRLRRQRRLGARCGGTRRHSAEHREAPPGGPAGTLGSHDRAVDLPGTR
ncbi:MAG: hypothetical protein WEG56_09665 [Chloroflexota bacterium]